MTQLLANYVPKWIFLWKWKFVPFKFKFSFPQWWWSVKAKILAIQTTSLTRLIFSQSHKCQNVPLFSIAWCVRKLSHSTTVGSVGFTTSVAVNFEIIVKENPNPYSLERLAKHFDHFSSFGDYKFQTNFNQVHYEEDRTGNTCNSRKFWTSKPPYRNRN